MDLPKYDPDSWQNQAQCALMRVDPAIMHPDVATRAEVEKAKQVCVGCPVLEQCRQHAVDQGPGVYGVHAGEWHGEEPVWQAVVVCACCTKERRLREYAATEVWFCSKTCRRVYFARQPVPA